MLSPKLCESLSIDSFLPSINKVDSPFGLVHFDVEGPSPIVSVDGYTCFIIFINHFSKV